jgi:hypothetical protein
VILRVGNDGYIVRLDRLVGIPVDFYFQQMAADLISPPPEIEMFASEAVEILVYPTESDQQLWHKRRAISCSKQSQTCRESAAAEAFLESNPIDRSSSACWASLANRNTEQRSDLNLLLSGQLVEYQASPADTAMVPDL